VGSDAMRTERREFISLLAGAATARMLAPLAVAVSSADEFYRSKTVADLGRQCRRLRRLCAAWAAILSQMLAGQRDRRHDARPGPSRRPVLFASSPTAARE